MSSPRARKVEAGATAGKQSPPKSKKKKLATVTVALLVILAAGGFVAKSKLVRPHYPAGDPPPPGKVFNLGTLTVNTSDGHLAQVGIDLQLTKPADVKQVESDVPEMDNAAIESITSWSYSQLLGLSAKTQLQSQLLSGFQKILGTVDGSAEQVSAVYFTSFLLQ